MYKRMLRSRLLRSRKRVVRISILAANVLLLVAVLSFVMTSPDSSNVIKQSSVLSESNNAVNPLDQLSSADIAVNVARMAGIYEAIPAANRADSINAQLAVSPSSDTVVAKPQVVSTALKSVKDLQRYTTVAGDTVGGLATRFGVTSDSIKWSNNLGGDSLSPGLQLWIPPVNGIVYTVGASDTIDSIVTKFHGNKDVVIAFNDAEVTGLKAGQVIVIPNGTKVATVALSYSSYYSGGFAWGAGAIYGYNGYDYGYCTWYVANRRISIGRPVPANLGDAWKWDDNAILAGIPVDHSPRAGDAVVTTSNRGPGHVAYVESVDAAGNVLISEMNVVHWNVVSSRTIPASEAGNYNYIH